MGGHENKGREFYHRHIVYSRLSSFEISLWQGIKQSILSMRRRIPLWAPWFIGTGVFQYLNNEWMLREDLKDRRKNPKDYENEE